MTEQNVLAATSAEPENYDESFREVKRLQRTLYILIAADLVTAEKVDQAYDIAGWK